MDTPNVMEMKHNDVEGLGVFRIRCKWENKMSKLQTLLREYIGIEGAAKKIDGRNRKACTVKSNGVRMVNGMRR
jgi:hypothetical protein